MSSRTSSECLTKHSVVLWIELYLHSEYYFVCKKDFIYLHARFQQIPKNTAALSGLFCCWRTARCWWFFSFKGESLWSVFTIILIDYGSVLNSRAIYLMERLGPFLTLYQTALKLLFDNMSEGVQFWNNFWCCKALCTSSPHHKLCILVLLAALLSLIRVSLRDKVQ